MTPKVPRPGIGVALEALPEAIAITLLAALPAFFNLVSERIFEEEKSLLLRAGAVLALPGVLLAWQRHGSQLRRQAIVITFAAFTLILVVAALAGVAPRDAIIGAYERRHGVVTALALAVMFGAMCVSAGSPAGRERLLGAIVIGSIWPSVYELLQRAGIDPVDWIAPTAGFLPGSTFGNHVFLGGYLALVIPLTAMQGVGSRFPVRTDPFEKDSRPRFPVFHLGVLALQIAALIASRSRGALAALIVGGLVFVVAATWTRIPRRAFLGALLTLGFVTAAVAAIPSVRPAAITRMFDPSVGSARVRMLIWQGTVALVRSSGRRLWIGYGPEGLHHVFPPYYSPEIGRLERTDAIPDRAHNETLDTLVNAGVPGVVLQLAFFAVTLAGALRIPDGRIRAGLTAASAGHLVEIQFGIATVAAQLAFLGVAAIVVGSTTQVPPDVASAIPRGGWGKRARTPAQYDRSAVPAATPWLWLSLPALFGALSPSLSMLSSRAGASATSGTASELVDQLSGVSLATPLLYGTLLSAALILSWKIASASRPATLPWLHGLAIVACLLAVIPLSIVPSRADIFSKAAVGFESRQQWPAAVIAYREASRMQPDESHYATGLGRALVQDSQTLNRPARDARVQAAQEAFERAQTLDPSDPAHPRRLASLFRIRAATLDETARAEPLAEADRLYARATGLAPGMPVLWLEWASVDVERDRLPQALEKVAHAMALDDTRLDAWLLRGHVHLLQENAREALADYDAALSRQPQNADALRGRAIAASALKRALER